MGSWVNLAPTRPLRLSSSFKKVAIRGPLVGTTQTYIEPLPLIFFRSQPACPPFTKTLFFAPPIAAFLLVFRFSVSRNSSRTFLSGHGRLPIRPFLHKAAAYSPPVHLGFLSSPRIFRSEHPPLRFFVDFPLMSSSFHETGMS